MVDKRNRIIKLTSYLQSLGVHVKIGKNKARGHKGFFKAKQLKFSIHIAKNQSEDEVLSVLVHEFAHFLHYKYDKDLKSLDFIFGKINDEITEELLALTVKKVSKDSATKLLQEKEALSNDIKALTKLIRTKYPDYRKTVACTDIEKEIKKTDAKYFLKYDRVKVLKTFQFKLYEINRLKEDFPELTSFAANYLYIRSKQRQLRRITSKIRRLNLYYNAPSELFARSLECFFDDEELYKELAPQTYKIYKDKLCGYSIPLLNEFYDLYYSL